MIALLSRFFNDIHQHISRHLRANVGFSRVGIVTVVDPSTHSAKVAYQPSGVESDWCVISEAWASVGSGTSFLPVEGDHVIVEFHGGSKRSPMITGRLYNDLIGFMNGVPGEGWIKHKSGSYFKLTNDGKLLLNGDIEIDLTAPKVSITTTGDVDVIAGGNLNANVTGSVNITAPTINLTGNVVISGNLSANNGNITMSGGVFNTNANIITSSDVQASGISLKAHVHSGVVTGGDDTGAPV